MSSTVTTYQVGQAVHFDGVPAVVLEADNNAGTLTVARFAGMKDLIGTQHSKLAPLDEDTITSVFAERIAEIRAYYRMTAERYTIRRDGRPVAYAGSMVDVLAWFHRHHSYSASHATAREGYSITDANGASVEV